MTSKNQNANNSFDEKPFNLGWLDSSYFETLFPSTPWQNIIDMLSLELAQVVREQFNNPHRKQMIIEILGSQFKRSYLADDTDNPSILYPPYMSDEQRKKLENEAKSWLQIKINEIAIKKNCSLNPDQLDDEICTEMKDYLEHTYEIVSTSFDRHLYSKQTKITNNLENLKSNSKTAKNGESVRNILAGFKGTNNLREVLKFKNEYASKPPKKGNLTSDFSELIGESLLCILQKDPRRIAFVLQKLIGQQLTNSLRKYIWSDILLRHERKKIETTVPIDIDLLVRKNFASGVTRGKNELKLNDPSQTPITGLIENAVIETYSRVYSMNEHLNEKHLKQTIKILNLLYTYSRDYEPYFIYWLLPFQLTFNEEKPKSELIYDLAMYLELYVKNLFPPWTEIFSLAGKIIQDLSINDPNFYEHLKKISKINPKINPKDFVNEIIYNENKKAINQLLNANDQELVAFKANKELLTEPTIFIRKWIGEGFSSILSKNALLYVWDQLFMSLWSSNDFEIITKSILYLLKNKFLKAKDHDEMRRVFLEQPCKLYTSDIQAAFMHLSSGRKESDVVFLNKREKDFNNTGYYAQPEELVKKKSNLDPVGLKDINLTLVVPKGGVTADFDPSKVIVEANLYYGNKFLSKKQTESIPLVKDIRSSLQDTKTYEITIMNDKLLFELAQFEHEPSNYKEIFVFINIKTENLNKSEFVLGHCKFSIYSPQRIGPISTWEVERGRVKRLLHPGILIQSIESIGDIPNASYKDRLGPGSNITFTVFDTKSDGNFI